MPLVGRETVMFSDSQRLFWSKRAPRVIRVSRARPSALTEHGPGSPSSPLFSPSEKQRVNCVTGVRVGQWPRQPGRQHRVRLPRPPCQTYSRKNLTQEIRRKRRGGGGGGVDPHFAASGILCLEVPFVTIVAAFKGWAQKHAETVRAAGLGW